MRWGKTNSPSRGRLAARSFTANHHNQRTLIAALRILSSAIVKSHTTFFPFFTNSLSPASSNEAAHFGQGCLLFSGAGAAGGGRGVETVAGIKAQRHDKHQQTRRRSRRRDNRTKAQNGVAKGV